MCMFHTTYACMKFVCTGRKNNFADSSILWVKNVMISSCCWWHFFAATCAVLLFETYNLQSSRSLTHFEMGSWIKNPHSSCGRFIASPLHREYQFETKVHWMLLHEMCKLISVVGWTKMLRGGGKLHMESLVRSISNRVAQLASNYVYVYNQLCTLLLW